MSEEFDRGDLEPFAREALARKRLLAFWARTMPAYDFSERVHSFVAEILENVSRGELGYDRVVITMQPGIGKSTMLRGYFASELGRKPGLRGAFISAADRLTMRNSEDTMALVREPSFPWSPMALDAEAKTHWKLANRSEVWALSVGSVLTGLRFDFALLDDIQSDEMTNDRLDDLETWLRRDFETRIDPGGSLVILQSRWGMNDIVGRLQSGADAECWRFFNLPAIAGEDDALGRAPGEVLSKRWPVELLERKKLTMGSVEFASQYMGDPMPAEGAMFQAPWFERRYDVLPELRTRVIGLDTAWKTGSVNDYSACVLVGIDKHANLYVIDMWHEKLLYPNLKARVMRYYEACTPKPGKVAIEDSAAGSGLIEEFIAETHMPVKRMKSTDSKDSRAATLSVHFENGKVFLPKSAPWLDDYIEEFLRYGARGSPHDDFVDATELAVRALHSRPLILALGGSGSVYTIAADGTSSRSTEAPLPSLPESDPSVVVLPAAKAGTYAEIEQRERLRAEAQASARRRPWEAPASVFVAAPALESAPLVPAPRFRTNEERLAWEREREVAENAATEAAAARIHGRRR